MVPQGTVTAPDGGADPGSAEARNAARSASAPSSPASRSGQRHAAKVRVRVTQGNVNNVRIVAVGLPAGIRRTRRRAPARSTSTRSPPVASRSPPPARSRPSASPPGVAAARAHRRHGRVRGADRRAERERGGARRCAVPAEPRLREPRRSGARTRACARRRAPKARTTRRRSSSSCTTPRPRTRTPPRRRRRSCAASTSITSRVAAYCDIGYNFLVDRYGIIFEGRYGGVDRGVIGAHATNFNTGTTGIAMIGDYSSVAADRRNVQRARRT